MTPSSSLDWKTYLAFLPAPKGNFSLKLIILTALNLFVIADVSTCSKFLPAPVYYVDPDSSSEWELGTQEHPFKALSAPFVELANYVFERHSITIFLKRGPTHFHNMGNLMIASHVDLQLLPYSNGTFEEERPVIFVHQGGMPQKL